jgi:hypothetical protein
MSDSNGIISLTPAALAAMTIEESGAPWSPS